MFIGQDEIEAAREDRSEGDHLLRRLLADVGSISDDVLDTPGAHSPDQQFASCTHVLKPGESWVFSIAPGRPLKRPYVGINYGGRAEDLKIEKIVCGKTQLPPGKIKDVLSKKLPIEVSKKTPLNVVVANTGPDSQTVEIYLKNAA